MKTIPYKLAVALATALMFAGVAAAQPANSVIQEPETIHTNRLALSMRFGFGVSARFKGIGGSFNPGAPAANGRRTPDGDAYNYDDGYVLTDSSGSFGNQTWYWGYDNSSQISGDNILFNRTTAAGLTPNRTTDADPSVGVEVTYRWHWGVKEDWHQMRYGIEAAANFTPISADMNSTFSGTVTRVTDSYPFTTGTTPPGAPYQGTFNGPGFLLGSVPNGSTINAIPGATLVEKDSFDADVFGVRAGPYVAFPITERLSLHASGGLAVGFVQGTASWNQTVTIPGEGTTTFKGSSDKSAGLLGGYVSVEAMWQLNERWNIEGGIQFQSLGKYTQDVGLRSVELDLSSTFFAVIGVGYTF
jgi:hypothetical protein